MNLSAPASHEASPTPVSPFAAHAARYDRMFSPLDDLLAADAQVGPSHLVIDVGCGAGGTSLALAARVGPGGHVFGIDVDAACIRAARARAAGLGNLTFVEGDATKHAFLDATADALVSRMGTLHFEDPAAGFSHLRCALRPGAFVALVAFAAPADNLWAVLPQRAVVEVLGAAPPASGGGAFAWADPGRPRRILSEAGFESVSVEPYAFAACLGDDVEAAAAFFAESHGAALRRAVDGATFERVLDALRAELRPYAGEDGVRVPAKVWRVTARSPG